MAKSKFKKLRQLFRMPEKCRGLLTKATEAGWGKEEFRLWWKRITDRRCRRVIKKLWRREIRQYLAISPCDDRLRSGIFQVLKDTEDGPHLGDLRQSIKRVTNAYHLWGLRRQLGGFSQSEFDRWWHFVRPRKSKFSSPFKTKLVIAFLWYRKIKRQAREDQKNHVPGAPSPNWENELLATP